MKNKTTEALRNAYVLGYENGSDDMVNASYGDSSKKFDEKFYCNNCLWIGSENETVNHFCPKCGYTTNYYDEDKS